MWLSGQLVLLDSPSGGPRFKDVDKTGLSLWPRSYSVLRTLNGRICVNKLHITIIRIMGSYYGVL